MPDRLRGHIAILGTRGYPSFYGGFETLVRKLAPYLALRRWAVTVYGRAGIGPGGAGWHHPNLSSVITPGIDSNSLSTLSYGLTSAIAALRTKPNVVLIMNVANGYWIPLLRARGISTVVNVDGLEWRREKWGRLAKVVFWVGAKLTARYADELIFDAQSIGDYWRNKFGRDGTFIPYGGESFAGPLMNRDQHLGAGRYVLLVARFVPENTVAEFFSIAPDLSRSHPVVLVGSGTRDGALERAAGSLARSYPNIFWLGHVSDDERLFSLWANAGVYFHGHSVGGTNPALVQAMACGAPIVARDTPFNREVLDTAGVFVKPTDETIKTAILELMGSLPRREQLSHKARARAARIYNWESICENYERLLENRVRRSGSQRAGRHAPASPPS